MIQMNRNRYTGAFCGGFGGGHRQFEIKIVEMRFRQAENNRRAGLLRRLHNALQKIQADQIECADRITMLVGVFEHVFHVDQWHKQSCIQSLLFIAPSKCSRLVNRLKMDTYRVTVAMM